MDTTRSDSPTVPADLTALTDTFRHTRNDTLALCAPLAEGELTCPAPDGSAPLWHLGHTTWFLETFLLRPFAEQAVVVGHPLYEAVFAQPPQAPLVRPTVEDVNAYRRRIDQAVSELTTSGELDRQPHIAGILKLSVEHEHRHQEALLEDILALYGASPFHPAYREAPASGERTETRPLGWLEHPGGEVWTGAGTEDFALADERPRHRRWLPPFALADRLVTNGEYLAFVEDDGYRRPELWLAAGWRARCAGDWHAPAYWLRAGDAWWTMTLHGLLPLDPAAPVAHLSYYEADAYARWAGARLPDEAEWEALTATRPVTGHLRADGLFLPRPAPGEGELQLYGDLWEWTRSPYAPYPGHRPPCPPLGEYDGRFPPGQLVLRGGACVTPAARLRPTLREHAAADCRRRFTGLRLARDLD